MRQIRWAEDNFSIAGATMGKIVVTGAGGYMGSVLVGQLLAGGHHVTAYDRFFFGEDILAAHQGNPALTLKKKDIRDADSSDFTGIDTVFDLAAFSNDPSGALDPTLTRSINHEGRAKVARLAKAAGVARYILASSCSVYGSSNGVACTETAPINPLTVYAECNYRAEEANLPLGDTNFCVTALRFSTLFGLSARMRFDLVINYMSFTAVTRKRVEIMEGGKQWRPLVHVQDAARALQTVMQADPALVNGQVFNIGHINAQIEQLAYIVKEHLTLPVEIVILPGTADKRDYLVDFSKAEKVLQYKATLTPLAGFDEVTSALLNGHLTATTRTNTVDWYRHLLAAKELHDSVALNGRYL
jgi:nucleoside-diphosphate-sugar epimerase